MWKFCARCLVQSPASQSASAPGAGTTLQFDRVALHLVVKRRPLNSEKLCRFLFIAVALRERLEDRCSLDVAQTLDTLLGRSGSLRSLQRGWQLNFGRQLFYADQVLTREYDRVFHGVLQFANISRPRVIEQFLESIWRHCWLGFAELLGELFHKKSDQRRNVFFTFAEWGHLDLESVETIIQIGPQPILR